MRRLFAAIVLLWAAGFVAASPRQEAGRAPSTDDPEIRAVVDRFFATQVAEDADAYLALWSTTAQRPTLAQLRFIFDSGDDVFTDVTVGRVTVTAGRTRVRVFATRSRIDSRNTRPDGTPFRYTTRLTLALTLVRETGALKIVSEGSPADDLATAILQAPTAEARAALMESEPDLVGEGLMSALSRGADTAARGGNFQGARTLYDIVIEVARRAGNRKAEGQALQNIANSAYFQRDYAAALEAFGRRLGVEREASNDEGIAESLVGIGTVKYARFEYADALGTFREAAAIQERLADGNVLGATLISTGNVQFIQGDYQGALADYTRSRDLLHKAFNFGNEARAVEGMGRTYAAQGDYSAALDAFGAVQREARAHGTWPMRGNAARNIGDVHFRVGNLDVARAAFEESRTHFEAAKDPQAIGRAWQAIALTDLVATRFAAAEQEYGKSIAACAPAGDRDCVARATVGLAFAQSSQEHFDEAIATYRKAIDAFAALNRAGDGARAEVGLSQALLGRKDYEQARLAAGRARQTATGIAAEDVLWRATTAEGRAWRRLGSPEQATHAARDAVAIVQRMADYAVRNPSQRVSPDTASAYAFLAVMQAETGDARGALVTLEQRRAHALRTGLATHEREIRRGMTSAEREDERAHSVAVASISAQLDQERQLPRADASRIQMLGARLADAITARSTQQQRTYERLPELRTWRALTAPPVAADVMAAVPPGTTVVHLAIDDDDLVAITISPGETFPVIKTSVRAIRRQALAEKVAALTTERLRDPVAWARVAADVAALLPEQALAALTKATTAVVIPDDVLWRVPFDAMPAGTGVVGDTVTIHYAASLLSLRAPAHTPIEGATGLLAVAAPELASERIETIRITAQGWTPRAPDEALREAERVAEAAGEATLLSGREATEASLRARAAAATLLHVGAPLRINGASPLFSRVYLSAGAGDDADDATLDAREVFNLETAAQLVLFSDGSAAAMRDAATGWPMVQWAWRAAGIPQIVAARWPGDAAATEALLGEFYARIKAGEPAAAALHAAQQGVRARPETRAPYFWAGWIVIGG